MDFCTVTIWYNPNNTCVSNILSYSPLVKKCYIVDNSDNDNSGLLNGIENVTYIPNLNNLGIAAALNIGCSKALEDGFNWCMTMDQDSYWDSNQLKLYFEKIKNNLSDTNVSFAPSLALSEETVSVVTSLFRKFFPKPVKSNVVTPMRVITSGNVINLNIWNEIGKFYEPLFIDDVDSEYSFRLIKYGYKICQFYDVKMSHELGTPRKTLLPFTDFHNGIRLYYMIRNILWLQNQYPEFTKKERYKKMYILLWIDKIFHFKFKDIAFMIQGRKALINEKMGSYNKV